ncbi:hypothetical protein Scep_025306 [Stephania cephalantha]|uniref:Uncharacterized protein n=1 Tax=Stephania cephalantha TaxID=152367 RepID=A0AAP0HR41_9MAGN
MWHYELMGRSECCGYKIEFGKEQHAYPNIMFSHLYSTPLLMFNGARNANKGLRRFSDTRSGCRQEEKTYESGTKAGGIPPPKKQRVSSSAMSRKETERDQEGNDIPVTPLVKGSVQSKVKHAQNESDVLLSFTMGASSSQQPSDLFRSLFNELKATVENRFDRIEDFLVSLDGRLQKMNDAFNKAGGDVCVGMRTMHKDTDCLLKRATNVKKKTKSSRHVTKEFIDRMEPMVDECERAFYERNVRKEWKRKTYPDNVNLDAD